MSDHNSKKQNFAPYAAIIIIAIVLIAIANAGAPYYQDIQRTQRYQSLVLNQQQLISSLSNATNQIADHYSASVLYHGAQMYLLENQLNILNNVSNKLDSLIAAHNEMINAIAQSAGHHTPTVIKNTYVHNTYCTVNQVYVPKCHGIK